MTRPHPQSDGQFNGTSRDRHPRSSLQYPNEGSNYGRATSYTAEVFDQRASGVYGYVVHVQTHAVPSSPAGQPRYDPQRDPQYAQAPRTSRTDYSQLDHVVNNPALNMAPVPRRHQDHVSMPSSIHRRSLIPARSRLPSPASRTRNTTYRILGIRSNAVQTDHRRLTTADLENHERRAPEQYQRPTDAMLSWERVDPHSGAYDAVGYIRRDGEVYDEDEVYEEYRGYDYDGERSDASY